MKNKWIRNKLPPYNKLLKKQGKNNLEFHHRKSMLFKGQNHECHSSLEGTGYLLWILISKMLYFNILWTINTLGIYKVKINNNFLACHIATDSFHTVNKVKWLVWKSGGGELFLHLFLQWQTNPWCLVASTTHTKPALCCMS